MKGILADNDVEGLFEVLLRRLQDEPWREFWQSLNLAVQTFATMGLVRDAPDLTVWQTCQEQQVVLITGNRNQDSPTSLETAIRRFNAPDSLPVITLANPARIARSSSYTERVVERLLEYLLNIASYRGAGRIYVP